MKNPRITRAVFAFAALMTLEAACSIGLAATPVAGVVRTGADASVTANMDSHGAQPADINEGPLTLTLLTPSGGTSRLTYVHEDGWRLEDRAVPLKQDEARITPASTERQQEAARSERPITVFIDGPTGFTYVWVADQGWKFVGRLSDRNR
ncbi:hypothetical protein QF000_006675 [Paraburkholderia atlantica]|uniref:hypothetical protein n=1 Tax=Paraburkholderia atlantica TaxID=2654982 RepID=UPI00128CB217|nr:hypothetical protein [Paraburkholderia atlantica]MPW10666.1 hypothetical protein [Paraburkholderia atlantica]NUY35170.1 hypothetical protein [Paraburkholderia atlantica]